MAKTTVTDILHRAGISKKTFYRYFENKDACVRAAYDTYSARLAGELAAAWSGAESPVEGARAAVTALLDFGAKAPAQLRFILLDARSAGPVVVAEHTEPLADLRPELVEFALTPLVGDAGARG